MRVLPLVGGPMKTVALVGGLAGRRPAAGVGAPSLCTRSRSMSVAAFARGRR